MYKMKILKLTILVLFTFSCFCQSDRNISFGKHIISVLSADSLFGRGYTKDALERSKVFLENEMMQMGLLPVFANEKYTDPLTINVNTFPKSVNLKIGRKNLTAGIDFLPDANSGKFNGKLKLLSIRVADLESETVLLEKVQDVLEGKYNGFLLDEEQLEPSSYRQYYSVGQYLTNLAPVVILTDQKLNFSVGRELFNFPLLEIDRAKFNPKKKIQLSIENEWKENFKTHNLAGKVYGKDTSRYIILCAHYDHLGAIGNEVIFNGAHDNASGVGMIMAMAAYFKENTPPVNLIILAVTAEEAGLVGSHHFVKNLPVPIEQITFVLNFDIVGSGEEGITVVNGKIFEDSFGQLEAINTEKQLLAKIKARGETQNSDHYPFYAKGVPAFFIYSMGNNQHYHDVFDRFENLSLAKFQEITELFITFIEQF